MYKTVVLDGGEMLTRPVDGEISLIDGVTAETEASTQLDGNESLITQIDGDASIVATMTAEVGIITEAGGDTPAYTGPTEITPTTSTQTLLTANKKVLTNITINPIPNNYGLITWNGSALSVS